PSSAVEAGGAAAPLAPAPLTWGAVRRSEDRLRPPLPLRPGPQGPGRAGTTAGAARAASCVGQWRTPHSAEGPLRELASNDLCAGAQPSQHGDGDAATH